MILEYENARGRSVVFAAPDGMERTPYYLTGLDGAHGVQAQIQAVQQYPQDGETYIGSRVRERSITLEGIIYGQETAKHRIAMLEAFAPRDVATLTATREPFRRRISCVVERAPYFSRARGDRFTLLLRCSQPYWEDAAGDARISLNAWVGLLEFPLEIPGGELGVPLWQRNDGVGIEFGRRDANAIANVVNPGDVETGFVAEFRAAGHVANPQVLDVETQGLMRFLVALEAGDVLRVSTAAYDKWAVLERADGTSENAMKYIDPTFQFLRLEPGRNMLRSGADAGAELLGVDVDVKALYLGL